MRPAPARSGNDLASRLHAVIDRQYGLHKAGAHGKHMVNIAVLEASRTGKIAEALRQRFYGPLLNDLLRAVESYRHVA